MASDQHSQSDEEKHILKWFGCDIVPDTSELRRFLDIGAFTGLELSNTRRLAELGWSGVMVEPAAGIFRQLMTNYADFPKIELVCAAIIPSSMRLVEFLQCDDAVSALSSNEVHFATWKAIPFQKTHVMGLHPRELLSKFPPPFDFVSIDVEGKANWDVVQAFPFHLVGASLVCVETDKFKEEMQSLLLDEGFSEVVYESPENLIVGRPA